LIVSLELQSKLVVKYPQITVAAAHDRVGPDRLHFLRNDADIGSAATIVAETIEAEIALKVSEKHDVVLQGHVGPPAATASAHSAAACKACTSAHTRTSALGLPIDGASTLHIAESAVASGAAGARRRARGRAGTLRTATGACRTVRRPAGVRRA